MRQASRRGPVIAIGVLGAGVVLVLAGATSANSAQPAKYFARAPAVARDGIPLPPPTPTPSPVDYGPPRALTLDSAALPANAYIEARHTELVDGRETFQTPTHPGYIAWYSRFSTMGRPGQNTIMAAHIDYAGYGNGPFRYLTGARTGDPLFVNMDNGDVLTFTVKSVDVVQLESLDMDAVVYPALPAGRERLTLISCGGTFVPYFGGGGAYDSRVILVAERIHD